MDEENNCAFHTIQFIGVKQKSIESFCKTKVVYLIEKHPDQMLIFTDNLPPAAASLRQSGIFQNQTR